LVVATRGTTGLSSEARAIASEEPCQITSALSRETKMLQNLDEEMP
jgi:hypothetical protein